MIVDDTADVKQRTGLIHMPAAGTRRIARRWIAAPLVHVEPVSGIERVFQELFELIDRANPVLHAFGVRASALLRMSAMKSSLHRSAPPL